MARDERGAGAAGTAGLAGRTAWVIGGGSGLGAASALALGAAGAEVVVSGRRADALGRTGARIEAAGGRARALPLDVVAAGAVEGAMAEIGTADILVYSSGTNVPRRSFKDIAVPDWRAVLDVNLDGAFRAVHAVLPGMRARGGGVIVIISSWVGWRLEAVAGAAYSASKRALLALTEVVNLEEGGNGVRATCLCPAEVDTEVLNTRPVPPSEEIRGKMLRAEDIGRLVGFIAAAPPHMCLNEIVVSPTTNRFYRAGDA